VNAGGAEQARLAGTLAHVCGLHLEGVAKSPDGHDAPLRPNSKIAIMPSGDYWAHYPSGMPGDHIMPGELRFFSAPPPMAGPPGGEPCPPCPLRALSMEGDNAGDVVVSMFGGHALKLMGQRVTAARLAVPRGALDAGPAGFAGHVMRLVVAHETRVCSGEPGGPRAAGRRVLLRGPTAIYCGRDELGIRHYCAAGSEP